MRRRKDNGDNWARLASSRGGRNDIVKTEIDGLD